MSPPSRSLCPNHIADPLDEPGYNIGVLSYRCPVEIGSSPVFVFLNGLSVYTFQRGVLGEPCHFLPNVHLGLNLVFFFSSKHTAEAEYFLPTIPNTTSLSLKRFSFSNSIPPR